MFVVMDPYNTPLFNPKSQDEYFPTIKSVRRAIREDMKAINGVWEVWWNEQDYRVFQEVTHAGTLITKKRSNR